MEEVGKPLKQLFQQEFSKMVSVIAKLFGLQHIELAEDIVSETFLSAMENWGQKGLPPNPTAWLYVVAKQKALAHFRRNKIFESKVVPEINSRQEIKEETVLEFSGQHIKDSQLQMMFAICAPAIGSEAQIGLALRILCGFGIDEIAEAFLSGKETINKRLFRAKEKLRKENIRMELPPENEMTQRLDNVLHIIYLLFNEGYYSKTQNQILRKDLCFEAMRLGMMLTDYEKTNLPKTNALMALMCFHASRFDARQQGEDPILYKQQDEQLWDQKLIQQGIHFLNLSIRGNEVTAYHIEARIAFRHCIKEDTPEKWKDILSLYDQLLHINYSPIAALNRIYAVYKVYGAEAGIREAEGLLLTSNHFYFVLLGELYKLVDKEKAKTLFTKALTMAGTEAEKKAIQKKLTGLS
ncbi:MAG TPA: sigma-70 family RNA polymerase sigma factor [Edaphocola sp.]|nr:sigma-70 family RNA polymerase sigma factor [Edaphocola sp.]